MPTALPEGMVIAATLPREDTRDALLSPKAASLAELPAGAVLGTSSLRRKAMALRQRPDLRVVDLRGNVETRIRKLDEGVADATVLAMAGLNRLGLAGRASGVLEGHGWLPAVAQGTIAIAARTGDAENLERLMRIDHRATSLALRAERAFLAVLDGSCRTPIGGLATIEGGELQLRGIIVKPDGSAAHEASRHGSVDDAARSAPRSAPCSAAPAARASSTGDAGCGSSSRDRSRTPGETAARLAAMGHEVMVQPMLRIVFAPPPEDIPEPAALIATSRNGARALAAWPAAAAWRATPLFVTGEGTARTAIDAGFTDVRPGGADAAALANRIVRDLQKGDGPILYAAARDRTGALAGGLNAAGYDVRTVEAYRAEPVTELDPPSPKRSAPERDRRHPVLLAADGAAFVAAMEAAGLADSLRGLACYALSGRVAEPLHRFDGAIVRIAENPDSGGLMALIERPEASP